MHRRAATGRIGSHRSQGLGGLDLRNPGRFSANRALTVAQSISARARLLAWRDSNYESKQAGQAQPEFVFVANAKATERAQRWSCRRPLRRSFSPNAELVCCDNLSGPKF